MTRRGLYKAIARASRSRVCLEEGGVVEDSPEALVTVAPDVPIMQPLRIRLNDKDAPLLKATSVRVIGAELVVPRGILEGAYLTLVPQDLPLLYA